MSIVICERESESTRKRMMQLIMNALLVSWKWKYFASRNIKKRLPHSWDNLEEGVIYYRAFRPTCTPLLHTENQFLIYIICTTRPHNFTLPELISQIIICEVFIQIMKLLIVLFYQSPSYFLSDKSKYSPQHFVLQHPQLFWLDSICQHTSYTGCFQKELCNFERVYKFIQRTYTTFWTVIM
jgi:hypothetical protein